MYTTLWLMLLLGISTITKNNENIMLKKKMKHVHTTNLNCDENLPEKTTTTKKQNKKNTKQQQQQQQHI